MEQLLRLAASVGRASRFVVRRRGRRVGALSTLTRLREAISQQSVVSLVLGHLRVVRSSGGYRFGPAFAAAEDVNRYLRPFLLDGLTLHQKREALIHHQRFSVRLFRRDGLLAMRAGIEVWRAGPLAMTLTVDRQHVPEGECALKLWMGDDTMMTLRFAFVAGRTFGFPATEAVLVTLIHGRQDKEREVREAASACGGVQPAYLLLAALEGLAAHAGVQFLLGVSNTRLFSQAALARGDIRFDYDRFWRDRHAGVSSDGVYLVDLAVAPTPLETPSAAHRRRGRRRREMRWQVRDAVCGRLSAVLPARAALP